MRHRLYGARAGVKPAPYALFLWISALTFGSGLARSRIFFDVFDNHPGDIFARGVLDYKQRELLTVAILASLEGTDSQLNAHIGIATNTGVSQAQLQGVAETLAVYKGRKYAARVTGAVDSVLGKQ